MRLIQLFRVNNLDNYAQKTCKQYLSRFSATSKPANVEALIFTLYWKKYKY